MSGSQTAANALTVAGAIRSGIFATAEGLGGALGPVGVVLEVTGAIAFGLGDGMAVQSLGEGLTGSTAGAAAALVTPGAIAAAAALVAGAPVEVPAVVVGAAVVATSLLADYGAKFLYNYLEENGDAILAAQGQSELDQAQAQLAMGQAIDSGITSIANTVANEITSLATQIGQAEFDSANNQLAAGQAISTWFGQAINSLGTTLSNMLPSIGGSTDAQSTAMSSFNSQTIQDAGSLENWVSNVVANPPTPSNPNTGNDFGDPQFISQFQVSLAGLDQSASDAGLTALASLSGTSQTLSSGLKINPLAGGNTNFVIPDSQSGGFDTFTANNGQGTQESVTNADGQIVQQETTTGTESVAFQSFNPATGSSQGSVGVSYSTGSNPITTITVTASSGTSANYTLPGTATVQTAVDGTATASGSGPNIQIGGDGAILAGGTGPNLQIQLGNFGTVTGGTGSNQIFVAGTGEVTASTNATINLALGSSLTSIGNNNIITGGANITVAATGNFDNISAGANSIVNLSGTASVGTAGAGSTGYEFGTGEALTLGNNSLGEQAVGSIGSVMNLGTASTLWGYGANDTSFLGVNSTIDLIGTAEIGTAGAGSKGYENGSGQTLTLGNNSIADQTAISSGSTVNLGIASTDYDYGTSNGATLAANGALLLTGADDSATSGANSVGYETGTSETITLGNASLADQEAGSSNSTVNLGITSTDYDYGTSNGATLGANGTLLLTGADDSATSGANSVGYETGTDETMTLGTASLADQEAGSSGSTVNLGITSTDYDYGTSDGATLAANGTLELAGTGDSGTLGTGSIGYEYGAQETLTGGAGTTVLGDNANGTSFVEQFQPAAGAAYDQSTATTIYSGANGTGTETGFEYTYNNGYTETGQYNPASGTSGIITDWYPDGTLNWVLTNYTNGTSSETAYMDGNPGDNITWTYNSLYTTSGEGEYSPPAGSPTSESATIGGFVVAVALDLLDDFLEISFKFDLAAGPLATSTTATNVIAQAALAQGNTYAASVAQADFADSFASAGQTAGATPSPLEGAKWQSTTITWSFAESSNDPTSPFSSYMTGQYQAVVEQAMAAWAQASGLTFQEVPDSATSDIRIGWGTFDTASSGVIGLTSLNTAGGLMQPGVIVRLEDPNEDALAVGTNGQLDYAGTQASLYQVALHEIGHALGLDDSSDPNSVMYYAASSTDATLDQTDINNIQGLYAPSFTATDALLAHAMASFDPATPPITAMPTQLSGSTAAVLAPGH